MSAPAVRTSRYRSLLRTFAVYGLVPYLAIVVTMTAMQRKLIYQPTKAESLKASAVEFSPLPIRDQSNETDDGITLNGWLIESDTKENESERNPLVIYFPGNAGHRQMRLGELTQIASCGFDVLIFDYRGYGDNAGAPSEETLRADARRVWDHARDTLNYSENEIVLFGESLGGAVALSLWSGNEAEHPRPAAVMLKATFSSLSDTVAWHYPLFPFQYLLFDRWESKARIAHVDCPIVCIHGTADDIVPVTHADILSQAAGGPMQILRIPGAGHNNLPMNRVREELERLREQIVGEK